MTDNLERVLEWLGPRDDFAIASHADPDGDSLGSSLALALALEQVGKRSTVVIGQSMPRRYRWLPDSGRVVSTEHVPIDARASILVECSEFERSGVTGLDTLAALTAIVGTCLVTLVIAAAIVPEWFAPIPTL